MSWIPEFKRWFADLFTPMGDAPVVPPTPQPLGRVLLRQAVIAQISGPQAPLIDKAAWVAHPHIVHAAALWGAERQAQELLATDNGPFEGAIDVDGRPS